jgi:hypothetical protein
MFLAAELREAAVRLEEGGAMEIADVVMAVEVEEGVEEEEEELLGVTMMGDQSSRVDPDLLRKSWTKICELQSIYPSYIQANQHPSGMTIGTSLRVMLQQQQQQ